MPRAAVRLAGLRAIGPGGQSLTGPPSHLTESKVIRSLFDTLGSVALCSLATVGPGNVAHSSHVYFAFAPDLRLYFLSDPGSGHCRHLAANSTMAVSVYDSRQRWGGQDRGLALYGTCQEARGEASAVARRVYGRRFKQFAPWWAGLTPGDEARGWRFYRFTAARVKVFDEPKLGPAVFVVATVRR